MKSPRSLLLMLCCASCIGSNRSNPLDGSESELFSPQITRPSGGDFWFAGSRQEIRWTPSKLASDSLVTVELICPDRILTIGSTAASTGAFFWVVTDSLSSTCHVKVSGQGGHSVSDQFKIRPSLVLNRLDIRGSGWNPAGLRARSSLPIAKAVMIYE